MSSDLTLQYVQPGACVAQLTGGNSIAISCALERSGCSRPSGLAGVASQSFVSSAELLENGSSTPGYHCLSSDGTDPRLYVYLGRCVEKVDEYTCTSHASNCKSPSKFLPQDELCTLLADLSSTRRRERSFFATCNPKGNDASLEPRCFWSSSECPSNYFAMGALPYSTYLFCTCEKTETGACRTAANGYMCAVSPDGCADPSSFLTASELQAEAGIDCRLCRPPTLIPQAIRPSPVVQNNGNAPAPTTTTQTQPQGSLSSSSDDDSILPRGAVIGLATAGGLVIGLALAVFVFYLLRRRRGGQQGTKGGTAIVVEMVDVNQPRHDKRGASVRDSDTSSAAGSSVMDVERSSTSSVVQQHPSSLQPSMMM